jgi:hypothetical protein
MPPQNTWPASVMPQIWSQVPDAIAATSVCEVHWVNRGDVPPWPNALVFEPMHCTV